MFNFLLGDKTILQHTLWKIETHLKVWIDSRVEMPRDKDRTSKSPKRKGKYNLRHQSRDEKAKKKAVEPSSSESSEHSESDEESDDGELDRATYRRFLAKLFPSRFINERIEEMADGQTTSDEDESSDADDTEERACRKKASRRALADEEETDSEEDESADQEDPSINIVFSIREPKYEELESETETTSSDEEVHV